MAKSATTATTEVALIRPPHTLQRRVSVAGNGKIDFSAVERAEKALEKLSSQFDSWMADETSRLIAARDEYLSANGDGNTAEALFHAAHDIKGQAPTLGYPLVSAVASSLCKLLERIEWERVPPVLLDQHVDAVRAIVDEVGKDGKNETGELLCKRLIDVTSDFIQQEEARKARNAPQA